MEKWKPIPSEFELEASSEGRIRVRPYRLPMPNGGERTYGGNPTFGQWDGKRYIFPRHGHVTLRVAPLICEAFNGSKPFPEAVCRHDDENPRNNRPKNLKWGTQKQNLNYPKFLSYCRSRIGEKSPRVKGA